MAAVHIPVNPVSRTPLRRALLVVLITLNTLTLACAGTQTTAPVIDPIDQSMESQGPAAQAADSAAPSQANTRELTPAMRYWQIRFLLGITEGLDGELLGALEHRFGPPDSTIPAIPDLAEFQGAGYRIASADSILDGLSDLAAFRAAAGNDLDEELARLREEAAVTIDALNEELLAEEILLVRSAALDSMETLAASGAWDPALNAPYRVGTVRARNELEYIGFAQDMDALAARNIDEATGRLDAFHRMMDDSNDTAFLRERVLAAEEMNRQITDEHREYATRRTIRTLFFLLPALSNYFRYR